MFWKQSGIIDLFFCNSLNFSCSDYLFDTGKFSNKLVYVFTKND